MELDPAHVRFAAPAWLWLAALGPPALAWVRLRSSRARARQLEAFVSEPLQPALVRSPGRVRTGLRQGLLCLAVGAVGLGLARPRWGKVPDTEVPAGSDVLFAVDCSRSMLATDAGGPRLARTREALLDILARGGLGRVGLVAFAGQAFLVCPLTADHDTFEQAVLSLEGRSIPVPGTNLGSALDEAARALDREPGRRIVVLLSDGEDLEKAGITRARDLGRRGLRVFTIGVGTAIGGAVPATPDQETPGASDPPAAGPVTRDRTGQPVESRLDESTLRAIAEGTGGAYRALGPQGEGLWEVRRLLGDGDSSPGAGNAGQGTGAERFQVPVALAVALWAVEALVGPRRGERRVRVRTPAPVAA